MSLKQKIWASYVIMIIVPLLLALLSAKLILLNYEEYNRLQIIESAQEDKIKEGMDFLEELNLTMAQSPDSFKNSLYQARLHDRISSLYLGVLIQNGETFVYNSLPLQVDRLKPYLAKFPDREVNQRWVSAITKDYLVKCRAFSFSDGTAGRIYLFISKKSPWETPPMGHTVYVKVIFLIFIICIFLTNSFLTYYMSKRLIEPLDSIKKAAREIQQGNLDCSVSYPAKNEIGELYQAFEEMRLKLKQSQTLNAQYENSRKELISNISHDLKTPITAIKGYVQGIMDGVANSPAKMEKYLRTIYTNTLEMERLTDDLFLFSRLDIKQLPFTFEPVDINQYFQDAAEELKFTLHENNIALSYVSRYQSNDLIMADRQRLVRVIQNIIENAKNHFNKQEKEIKIVLTEEKDQAVIEISDNGCGISTDKLPYIFDRFFRVDSARNRATGGSGIGLSIAKQIIEAHQGIIWAESAEGLGTSIFFSLKKVPCFKIH